MKCDFPKLVEICLLGVDGAKTGVTTISSFVLAPGKPSVDPATAKLWTLSANDTNDEEMVSGFICEASLLFLLSPLLSYSK